MYLALAVILIMQSTANQLYYKNHYVKPNKHKIIQFKKLFYYVLQKPKYNADIFL